ncbi:stage II sporulation protein M [Candidatus Pacearchaeota archaeon]|nr:stage II sporulation protein M [Candidatus Pacearchaeota archaeon]
MKKNKKHKNFLAQNYADSFGYIKESKNFIYLSIIVFSFFYLLGFLVQPSDYILSFIIDFVEEILERTKDMSQIELIEFVFLNNIQSSFFAMVLGIFLGIFPIFVLILNGYVVGFVSLISIEADGAFSILRLLPHGIFELPAIFISAGLGIKLGTFLFQKNKYKSLKYYFINSCKVFFLVVLPLLIIAAIIEGSLIFFGR